MKHSCDTPLNELTNAIATASKEMKNLKLQIATTEGAYDMLIMQLEKNGLAQLLHEQPKIIIPSAREH